MTYACGTSFADRRKNLAKIVYQYYFYSIHLPAECLSEDIGVSTAAEQGGSTLSTNDKLQFLKIKTGLFALKFHVCHIRHCSKKKFDLAF